MSTKYKIFLGVVLLPVAAMVLLWKFLDIGTPRSGPSAAEAILRNKPTETASDSLDGKPQSEAAGSVASSRAINLSWQDAGGMHDRLQKGLATNDNKIWEPVIGELVNPNYKRGDAIAILSELLEHQDWRVRIRAAQQLIELGSYNGVSVLHLAIKSAAVGVDIPAITILTAASMLHRTEEKIDPLDMQSAYQKTPSRDLLEIAALQGHPWVADVIRHKRVAKTSIIPTELPAAYLGMNDPESIQRYNLLLTLDSGAKVLGNWALYRATGDNDRLQYLIDIARELEGSIPKTEKSQGEAKNWAINLLSMTENEIVKKYLEEVANREATKESGDGISFSRAVESLFFVQKDYKFIDQLLLGFMRGDIAVAGSGSKILWELASIRRTPEIERLALIKNASSYDYNFIRMGGRQRMPQSNYILSQRDSSTMDIK